MVPELTNQTAGGTVCPTMDGAKLLTVESINEALACLSEQLAGEGDKGELVIVGGAAIALTLGGREATRDIDGYISKPEASGVRFDHLLKPALSGTVELALAAGVTELLAEREHQAAPDWTRESVSWRSRST